MIKEEIQIFFEAKEIIVDKKDFEIMYLKNSKDLWLIPKKGKVVDSMKRYIRRLKGLGIVVDKVEKADRGSLRIILQSKIKDPLEIL